MAPNSDYRAQICTIYVWLIDTDTEVLLARVRWWSGRVALLSLLVLLVSAGGGTSVPVGAASSDATDATGTSDVDGDGLSAFAERTVYGTAPTDADTDGDGYPDGLEVRCTDTYPEADPLRQDVYVEVDATGTRTLGNDTVAAVERAFATAPVSNDDAADAIAIHVRTNDTALGANGTVYGASRDGDANDVYDYHDTHFDHRAAGYYYVLLSDDVAYDGNATYVGAGEPGLATMEPLDSTQQMASLFVHELGHSFGLGPGLDGVDASRYSATAYASVMNYNALYDRVGYSDGSDSVGRDEWAFVADDRYRPSVSCPEGCASSCPAT